MSFQKIGPPFFVRPIDDDPKIPWYLLLVNEKEQTVGYVHVKPAGKGLLVFDTIDLALSEDQPKISLSRVRLLLLLGRILWPFSTHLSVRLVKWFA